MGREELHHKREKRRLRAAEIVAAVAIGDVAPGIDLRREIGHHILNFIPVPALRQAQHGEVAIPVIHFTEATAWHHVGFGQRQQRVPLFDLNGTAGQHRPQAVDMLTQRLALWRNVAIVVLRQGEVQLDEMAQVEAGLVFLHAIVGEDHQRVAIGDRIGKGFLVGEEPGALHIIKQRAEHHIRGWRHGFGFHGLGGQRR